MEFTYEGIALIPIVAILVRMVKITGVPKQFYPIISVGIGVVFGLIFIADGDYKMGILSGIVIGISASGLYSNGKELSNLIRGEQK